MNAPLPVASRPQPLQTGVKLRGAEKVARIPVKILPTEEIPRKPEWIRVPIATSPILPGVLDRDEIAWLNDYHRQVFAKLAPHLNDAERVWLAEKCAAISC